MAASNQLHFEDELACTICLKLFTDPVTIPCGHTICMRCITSYWDEEMNVEAGSCPKCHGNSSLKTRLHKNSILCKDVKVSKSVKKSSEESCFNPNDPVCDFCTSKEVKAIKSCLDCVASFCETHIRTHQENAALKLHKLVNAACVENGLCKRHKRPLELFCRTDKTLICCICIVQEHGNHTVVTKEEEREEQQSKLSNQGKSLERDAKVTEIEIEDLRKQTDSIRSSAITLQEDINAKFNELIQDIEEAKLRIVEFLEKEEQVALSKIQETIARKEKKSTDLRKEKVVMQELLEIVDDIKFLRQSKAFSSKPREPSSQDN
ncbi:tripartite motif-containing protein 29-like [Narcine bancroftii]|uniref:tripartite motif-containing protein 29-like n=1 Tax=Narcine bancroftii TaxID=1343680 RepID=UPI00383153DD